MSWHGASEGEMRAEETGLSCSELSAAIDEWIFSERDRAILKRRLLDGLCYEALADEFDLSPRHVKRIVYKAEERLFSRIK